MSVKTVFFHCAQPIVDANGEFVRTPNGSIKKKAPTHTLAFEKYGDNGIIMGWSKVHANDNYSKSEGSRMAIDRIEQVKNRLENFSNRPVLDIDSIDDTLLPSKVIDNSFDYFFEKAVSKLFNLDEIDTITMYFKTVKVQNTVCSIELDVEAIKENIENTINSKIEAEKEELYEFAGQFIFATFYDDNDALNIVIQERAKFYTSGLDVKSTEFVVNTFDNVFAEKGFTVVKEDEMIFQNEKFSELPVIRILKDLGLQYDLNLQSEFVK